MHLFTADSVTDADLLSRFINYHVPAGEWEKARYGLTHVLHFTPDGTKLITGHADTTALVWPVPPRRAK
jgi:hypothetical protein